MVNKTEFYFTNREKNIIEYIKLGYSNKQIAKTLYISLGTVKKHVSSIINKTNAINRVNLIFILAKNKYFN
ncbi:two component transcriptional regulator LuxR family [Clostridium sp. CAG:768]|uniref:response regulator transcription factor n=1 Tax=Candidatus Stercorousia sp. TaxID=3048886 RepID=UPI00033CEB5D|nr:two component transcriptional regulator LuxR family [Clostridium sp. CAG:768]